MMIDKDWYIAIEYTKLEVEFNATKDYVKSLLGEDRY